MSYYISLQTLAILSTIFAISSLIKGKSTTCLNLSIRLPNSIRYYSWRCGGCGHDQCPNSERELPRRHNHFSHRTRYAWFSSRPLHGKLGWHGTAMAELIYGNLRIPDGNILGKVGDGFKVLINALDDNRVGNWNACIGMPVL